MPTGLLRPAQLRQLCPTPPPPLRPGVSQLARGHTRKTETSLLRALAYTVGGEGDRGGITLEMTRQIDNTRFRSARARNSAKPDRNLASVWRKVTAWPPGVLRDPGKSPGGYSARAQGCKAKASLS